MLRGAMMVISKMRRGESYSCISSPTRLNPWESEYTRGVHEASVGNIHSNLPIEAVPKKNKKKKEKGKTKRKSMKGLTPTFFCT